MHISKYTILSLTWLHMVKKYSISQETKLFSRERKMLRAVQDGKGKDSWLDSLRRVLFQQLLRQARGTKSADVDKVQKESSCWNWKLSQNIKTSQEPRAVESNKNISFTQFCVRLRSFHIIKKNKISPMKVLLPSDLKNKLFFIV